MNQTYTQSRVEYDMALRAFMLAIYNYTAAGVALTGVVAYLSYATGLTYALGALMWVVVFAPLAMILAYSSAGRNWSFETKRVFYFAFAAVMGISMSTIFAVYTAISIAQVFFITAATFASASIVGYTTKRDLTGMGSFMFIGLIGIIIAAVVNIFLQSSALEFAISIIGVIVFVGLTAYDTQNAKSVFVNTRMTAEETARFAIDVTIGLYLNFVNLFQMLLNLLGQRE